MKRRLYTIDKIDTYKLQLGGLSRSPPISADLFIPKQKKEERRKLEIRIQARSKHGGTRPFVRSQKQLFLGSFPSRHQQQRHPKSLSWGFNWEGLPRSQILHCPRQLPGSLSSPRIFSFFFYLLIRSFFFPLVIPFVFLQFFSLSSTRSIPPPPRLSRPWNCSRYISRVPKIRFVFCFSLLDLNCLVEWNRDLDLNLIWLAFVCDEVEKLPTFGLGGENEPNWIHLCSFWNTQESTISSLKELLGDPAIGNNPILRLIAGIVFMHEQDYNEALKHTHPGGTMEL